MRRHFDQNGNPQFFDNPDTINNGVYTGGPVRLPYPGEAGERNKFRGMAILTLIPALPRPGASRPAGMSMVRCGSLGRSITPPTPFDSIPLRLTLV